MKEMIAHKSAHVTISPTSVLRLVEKTTRKNPDSVWVELRGEQGDATHMAVRSVNVGGWPLRLDPLCPRNELQVYLNGKLTYRMTVDDTLVVDGIEGAHSAIHIQERDDL